MERDDPAANDRHFAADPTPWSTAWFLVLVAFAGILLTLTTFGILRSRAEERAAAELSLRADSHKLHIERFAERHLQAVQSLRGLFEASEEVTQDEFRSFAENQRDHSSAAAILAWFPQVRADARERFEGLRPANRPALERGIWELGDASEPIPAGDRDEYFPAVLVDPLDERSTDLGFDLGSEGTRLAAIQKARDTSEMAATPCIDLQVVGDAPERGIVVVVPVYSERPAPTREARRAVFQGVVAAVIPIDSLIEQALAPVLTAELALVVLGDASDGDPILFRRDFPLAEIDAVDCPRTERAVQIADRSWRAVFRVTSDLTTQVAIPWIILVLGLLLCGMLATYAYTLTTRQAAVIRLAEERARALIATRESLERARAERQHAERLLLDAVDRISQGIALFGPDDRILFFNRNYPDSFQLSGSDLLAGASFEEIIREQVARGMIEDAVGREEEWIAWRLEQHRTPGDPIEVRRHTGKVFRIVEHRLPNGGTFSVVTDISRERKNEEQLRQSQRMEGIGQLTGGIAHDFNNLLTVIMGNLDLVEEAVRGDEELNAVVGDANRAAQRGAELTQRLLAFARRQPLLPAITDVNQLVERMSALLRRTLGETIRLETELAPDVWPTLVDASQLETAVLNLVVNARDAMPDGGRLLITTANTIHEPDVTAEVETPGPFVEIAVVDNGVGMPRIVSERAFEPFFTTKEVGKGSGLGLSMVYGFVRQSGGHVEIESAPNHGTTVRLYLPRTEQEAMPQTTAPTIEEEPLGQGERVVVVEDDDELRDLVERTLEALGYVVISAPNGPEALSITNGEEAPDLLLTDVVLPEGINGIELAGQFRDRYDGLKVLFMSGYSDAQELRGGRVGRLLRKPFRREQLAREVRDVIEGR